ncbi:MAG TPA: DUF3618 domain-containing protein [Kofleriaceae bacterium]
MRDPQVIAREIDEARHDLEASLGELKELVRYKLDIKQRARQAVGEVVEHGIGRARDAVWRAADAVRDAGDAVRQKVQQYPAYAVLAAGLFGGLVFAYVQSRRRRRWW